MMNQNNTINITMNGKEIDAIFGSRISELLGRVPHNGDLPPLGAIVNNRLTGLYRKLTVDSEVTTVDYNSKPGADIYRRSACMMLYTAVNEIYPNVEVEVGQSIGEGYFFELHNIRVTKTVVAKIEKQMHELVRRDIPFLVERVAVEEALRWFEAENSRSKVNYLLEMPRNNVGIVSLLGFKDLVHGPFALSTGTVNNLGFTKYRHGLLMTFPDRNYKMRPSAGEQNHTLLFDAYMESRDWNELVDVQYVTDLNKACINGTVSELIKVGEALHDKKILQIADMILSRKPRPRLVLLAGPSSAGKTTSSQRLRVALRVSGITVRTISMDNYYINREDTPKLPDGSYDFESVRALDLPLFNDHLKKIIDGQHVETPIYDFQTGKRRKDKTIPIQLEDNQILVIEGIHALNDKLHKGVAKKDKFGIFVSALTQLCIDEHNRIFTSDTRLIRRLVRDRLYRGYSAAQTIENWPSVRAGEEKYIFPFQNNADVLFNSALVYEPAVLKHYAKRFLLEVSRSDPAYSEATRLYFFLENFIPIFPEEVPPTSVIREFIGGSTFNY